MANKNYDKLSEQQKVNLLTKNQQANKAAALEYAQRLGAGIQAAGQAAMRGGVVGDVRPGMPGNQNATQAQYTKLLQGGITGAARAGVAGMSVLAKLRAQAQYQKALKNTSAGSGIYRDDIYRGGVGGTVGPQRVL